MDDWIDIDTEIPGMRVRIQLKDSCAEWPSITGMLIEALEGEITATTLRELPFARLRSRGAFADSTSELDPDIRSRVLSLVTPPAERDRQPKRRQWTDEDMAFVATLYVALCESNEPSVTSAMAQRLGVRESYVPKLLARATDKGMLEGRKRGRRGGRATERALGYVRAHASIEPKNASTPSVRVRRGLSESDE